MHQDAENKETPAYLRRLILASVFTLFVPYAHAQFEGIVESKNITTDEMGVPQEFVMTISIKKDMVRIDTKSNVMPGSTMIYRNDLRRIWMMNPDDKTYFEISQDEKPQELLDAGGSTEKYSVKRTGKSRTIAGYRCEQLIIKREGEETQLWGTAKLKNLITALSKALGQENTDVSTGPTAEVMKMGIYPMSSTTRVEGQVVESQDVTKVEIRKLDAEPFSIPAGYKKQKTLDMMQEMRDPQDRK